MASPEAQHDAASSDERSGLVARAGDKLCFFPTEVVLRVLSRPTISPVPGSELGMTLLEGRVAPVVALGPESDHVVVCRVEGEDVALSGLEVLASGYFVSAAAGGVEYGGHAVASVELSPILERARRA